MELQLVWYGLKRKSMLFALFYLSGVYHLYIIMVCSFVFSFLFFSGMVCGVVTAVPLFFPFFLTSFHCVYLIVESVLCMV